MTDTLIVLAHVSSSLREAYAAGARNAGVEADVVTLIAPGSGLSSKYDKLAADCRAADPDGYVLRELLKRYPPPKPFESYRTIVVGTYSAGYALPRGFDPLTIERVDAVVMIDSGHTDHDADGTASDRGVAWLTEWAVLARAGKKVVGIGHTDLDPVTYASTTEVAAEVIRLSGDDELLEFGVSPKEHAEGLRQRRRSWNFLVESYDRRPAAQDALEHGDAVRVWGPGLVAWAVATAVLNEFGDRVVAPEPPVTPPIGHQEDTGPLDYSSGLEGIDVSSHQGAIDWRAVAKAGIRYVYIRVSEGVGWEDGDFAKFARGAAAAGIPRGGYHVIRPRRGEQDGEQQAREYLVRMRREGLECKPMVDVEDSPPTRGLPAAAWADAIRGFSRVIEGETGEKPLLYTYPGFWDPTVGAGPRGGLSAFDEFAAFPLWIAHYTRGKPIIPRPWKRPLLWQYAAGAGVRGYVMGVPGMCDRNRLFGTMEALAATTGHT